jgi:hypothetical protein
MSLKRFIRRAGALAGAAGSRTSAVNALCAAAAATVLCATARTAAAQCVMCGKNAEYAGGAPGKAYATLATASLILLLPAVSLLCGAGALLWKYRKAPR